MHFTLDLSSPKPVYQQLIDQVKRAFASGRLRPGDRLPPIRDLAVELRVNRNTIARVYSELEREGLVSNRPGVGTHVTGSGQGMLSDAAVRGELTRLLDDFLAQARVYAQPRDAIEALFAERLAALYKEPFPTTLSTQQPSEDEEDGTP